MAYTIAERLRRTIGEKPIKCHTPEGELAVSTSIGGAIIKPGAHHYKDVLARADKALYEAKNGGRNAAVFETIGKLEPENFKLAARRTLE
jgi:diguanylate cyclase (GGDEF)-like protein